MEDKSDSCDYSAQGVNTEPLESLRREYASHAGSQNTRMDPPQNVRKYGLDKATIQSRESRLAVLCTVD